MNKTEWLLSKVAEEANEVAQIALKAQKYGIAGVRPGSGKSNLEFLREEFLDFITAIQLLEDHLGVSINQFNWHERHAKQRRVLDMMKVSKTIGTLDEK